MKIFGREPTLYIAVISSAVVVLGTLGFQWIDAKQAALLVTLINAVAAAANGFLVRPVSPALFTYAVGAAASVVAAYGLEVPQSTLAAVQIAVVPILALLTRNQVSPTETPLTRTTTADEAAVVEPGTGPAPSATV